MKNALPLTLAALGLAVAILLSAAARTDAARSEGAAAEPTPVLVELFTSEGCSSCPPADALVAELAREQPIAGVRVVPLGYHVTYWDRLGWRDRFSDPAWTERQNDYALALGLRSVYTPQAVVGGASDLVASRRGALIERIEQSARRPRIPLDLATSIDDDVLTVRLTIPEGAAPASAEAWVALAEDGLATDVERGENRDRRLRHVAVVRARESLGPIPTGAGAKSLRPVRMRLDPGWRLQQLTVVAVAQEPGPGEVLAVAARPLLDPR